MGQASWDELQDILLDSRLAGRGDSRFKLNDCELEYLRGAFETTERLWHEAIQRVKRPRIVLLGEAPLFGANGSYIYADDVAPTAFLRPGDFSDVLAADGGLTDPIQRKDKQTLLAFMDRYGVVIVDAYPFALNEKSTPNLFYSGSQMRAYLNKLLDNVFPIFANPKIAQLRQSNPDLQVLVRYKRLLKKLKPMLLEMGFKEHVGPRGFSCVGSNNMEINRELFTKALLSAT